VGNGEKTKKSNEKAVIASYKLAVLGGMMSSDVVDKKECVVCPGQ
jgi:hypothetical protein